MDTPHESATGSAEQKTMSPSCLQGQAPRGDAGLGRYVLSLIARARKQENEVSWKKDIGAGAECRSCLGDEELRSRHIDDR